MTPRQRYQIAAPGRVPGALRIVGVGLTVQHHPAHALWARVQAEGVGKIPPPDPAGTLAECHVEANLFRTETLRSAFEHWPVEGETPQQFVENYPVPGMFALPTRQRALPLQSWADGYIARVREALRLHGRLTFHDIAASSSLRLQTDNDLLWAEAFRRFDEAGDLHSLMLWAEDGYAIRAETGGWENARNEPLPAILARNKRPTDLSDCFAALMLVRPPMAQWLRELSPHVVDACQVTDFGLGRQSRTAHGFGRWEARFAAPYRTDGTPFPFAPTAHVPAPWSAAQIAQYDAVPTLAWVHRPHVVSFMDENKRALQEPQCVAQLQVAMRAVLAGPLEGQAPARLLFDTGPGPGEADRVSVLMGALRDVLPGFDVFDPASSYHLTQRLGDTGAVSAFAGVGLAGLASWEAGGAAMVVNLRRDDGATVLAVKPVNAAYRAQFTSRPYEAA